MKWRRRVFRLQLTLAAVLLSEGAVATPPTADGLEREAMIRLMTEADPRYAEGAFRGSEASSDWWKGATAALEEEQREQTAVVSKQLEAAGVTDSAIPMGCYSSLDCSRLRAGVNLLKKFPSFEEFHSAFKEAHGMIEGYLLAVETLERVLALEPALSARERLAVARVVDQTIRVGAQPYPGRRTDPLSPQARHVFLAYVGVEITRRDLEHSKLVAELLKGDKWPSTAEIGEEGQNTLWLLTQHADADPVLQMRGLRLMAPAVNADDGSARNYAYLYDRVMLKLRGKQRFGTQAHCVGAAPQAQPLEDASKVDDLRRSVGLPPLTEYLRKFPGKCGA